jgi:hypothetical protein
MAVDITISLTDAREATLGRLTAAFNSVPANVNQPVTPAQFMRQFVKDWLDLDQRQFDDNQRLKLRAAYLLATPSEQAAIDLILNKYRQ